MKQIIISISIILMTGVAWAENGISTPTTEATYKSCLEEGGTRAGCIPFPVNTFPNIDDGGLSRGTTIEFIQPTGSLSIQVKNKIVLQIDAEGKVTISPYYS